MCILQFHVYFSRILLKKSISLFLHLQMMTGATALEISAVLAWIMNVFAGFESLWNYLKQYRQYIFACMTLLTQFQSCFIDFELNYLDKSKIKLVLWLFLFQNRTKLQKVSRKLLITSNCWSIYLLKMVFFPMWRDPNLTLRILDRA